MDAEAVSLERQSHRSGQVARPVWLRCVSLMNLHAQWKCERPRFDPRALFPIGELRPYGFPRSDLEVTTDRIEMAHWGGRGAYKSYPQPVIRAACGFRIWRYKWTDIQFFVFVISF
jgi:hypothetical protein